MDSTKLRELKKEIKTDVLAAQEVAIGIPIPAVRRVELFSPEDWELFIEEWAHSLGDTYLEIKRYGGPGDKGCDVICFTDEKREFGVWDNYQGKHYDHSLTPSDIWVELGKLIYYSFKEEYVPPRKYYFIAPHGIGIKLNKLFSKPKQLKADLATNWQTHCELGITSTVAIPLEGKLKDYVDNFDFTIFSSKSVADLIEGHSKTPFYTTRFGGGLPARPAADKPPVEIGSIESRYVQQLFDAYADHLKIPIDSPIALVSLPDIENHFLRSRERFYHAESLRNFARDTVPPGTFEDLQGEVYDGVIDVCESSHGDALSRVNATVIKAGELSITSNALVSRMKIKDKQGICHQLANEDRLTWVKKKNG